MPTCSRFEGCSFFHDHMKSMPSIAELFRKRLCHGDHTQCARYYVFSFIEKNSERLNADIERRVSDLLGDLYPNELSKAKIALPNI